MIKGNKYTFTEDKAIIHIKDKEVFIDLADYPLVSQYTWGISSNGYVISYSLRRKTGKIIHLHRLLTDCPSDMKVDHANNIRLDNRRGNLRICTSQQNNINVAKYCKSKSKYKGVTYCKNLNKWRAKTKHMGKTVSLGYYDTEEEGALAYNNYMLKHHKEFAKLNVIEGR